MAFSRIALLGPLAAVAGCCATPAEEALDSITLSEGPCFGFCPVYEFTIFENDTYELDGQMHTRTSGETSGALPAGSWLAAREALTTADFFSRPNVTPGSPECGDAIITDLQDAEISFIDAEPMTSSINVVQYYPGCVDSIHKPALDQLIEDLKAAMSYDTLVAPAP